MTSSQIKAFRATLRLTQEQLAYRLGVTSRTIYLWEAGKCQPSSLAVNAIERLAQECKIPLPLENGNDDYKSQPNPR